MTSLLSLFLPSLELFLCTIAFAAVVGSLIFTLDDLWIDFYALVFGLRPQKLSDADLVRMHAKRQKKFAIIIANWQEDEILDRMIVGNIAQLDYQNYTFFLGVYPNDEKTWQVAQALEARFQSVVVIVNSQAGPTTKGQMLNEIVSQIIESELHTEIHYDYFLLQDSEDILHPLSLKLINDTADDYDFIQIPVFSFDLPLKKWVGATYIDEFSEVHTKDLLVREKMGAAIPSAGVGTAMSDRLVRKYRALQGGHLLREDTLTEDYLLGLMAKSLGLKSRFICTYREKRNGVKDFIATREYFPARFWSSVRQKTRWTLGIAFQGKENLRWQGDWADRYFMFRDRRGPWNSILILLSLIILFTFVSYHWLQASLPTPITGPIFVTFAALNMVNMIVRVIQRMRSVHLVNGALHAVMVPLRWPICNLINFLAAFYAFQAHRLSVRTGHKPQWNKTKHELPENFGDISVEGAEVQL